MTNADRLTVVSETTCDLFGRPASFQTINHVTAQTLQSDQLSPPRSAIGSFSLGNHTVVAVQVRDQIDGIKIPLDLSVDSRAVPANLSCNLANWHIRVQHAFDCVPFTQIQFCVGHIRSPCFSAR